MSWKSNDDGSHYQRKSPKGKRKSSGSGSTRSNSGKKIGKGVKIDKGTHDVKIQEVMLKKLDENPPAGKYLFLA